MEPHIKSMVTSCQGDLGGVIVLRTLLDTLVFYSVLQWAREKQKKEKKSKRVLYDQSLHL